MGMCEPSIAPTTYGIWCKSWNSCTYLSIVAGPGQLMNFLSKIFFMAPQNCEIACWLDDRPILYKSTMHCIELPEANLIMDTATFTWTGMAKRMFVSRLYNSGARMPHKYSNEETSIRILPLNSLELNEPNKLWSKKPSLNKPRSWAHNRRRPLPRHCLNPCKASVMQQSCCQCPKKIAVWPIEVHSNKL